jgi:tape measure domain-containing protein
MVDYATLGIKLESNDLKRGKTELGQFTKAGKDTERETAKSMGGVSKSFSSVTSSVKTMAAQLVAVAGVAATVRKALGAAEEYANMRNGLLGIGSTSEQAASQLERLSQIARGTRTPLEATASLYTKMRVSAQKSIGATDEEMFKFSQTIATALAASGTSATAASGALTQLSQAMSGGVVRAEEFNSMIEGAPGLLIAVANGIDGVNGDLGALRQMMLDGKLTSEVFFDAMLSQSEVVKDAFGNTTATIGQAFQVLNDSFTVFIGTADQGAGLTSTLADAILLVADNLDVLIPILGLAVTAILAISAPVTLTVAALAALAFAVVTHWDEITAKFNEAVSWFGDLGNTAALAMLDLNLAVARGIDALGEAWDAAIEAVVDFGADLWGSLKDTAKDALKAAEEIGNEIVAGIKQGISEKWKDLKSYISDLGTGMLDGIKDKLGIRSPSREFAKIGRWSVEGLAQGIDENTAVAEASSRELGVVVGDAIGDLGGAWKDFVVGGFEDFKDFAKNVLNIFKNMLFDMIFTAKRNPINFTGGISGGGGAVGTAVQAAGGGGGAGGIMGGLGGIGGSFISGAKGVFTAFGGGGGLASVGTYYSSLFAGATTSLGGFAAAAGAVALPLAAVVAAISFFKKKVTELDRGINFAAENMAVSIEGYKKINTKRFWGLSSKDSEQAFDGYDEGIPAMVKAVNEVQQGIVDAAAALGIGAEAFDKFTYEFQSSFKDMTDEQIQAELTAKFRQLGHDFAVLIPGLEGLTKEGELASDTLVAMVENMRGVNFIFETLGLSAVDATLSGAALASTIVELFGSMDNFNSAATAYYQAFYTEQERTGAAFGQLRDAMAELGEKVPATREAFRALVEQTDAMGDPTKTAKLIGLAGAFDAVMSSVDSLTTSLAQSQIDAMNASRDAGIASAQAALSIANNNLADAKTALRSSFSAEKDRLTAEYEALVEAIKTSQQENSDAITAAFDASITGLEETLTDARERLALSQSIADALDSALRSRLFPGVVAQRIAQDKATAYLAKILANGEANDIDKLNDALSAVADPSADTYRTLEEYRLDFDRQTAIISQLKGNADIAMSADALMVQALEGQIDQAQANHDAQMQALGIYHAEELDIERQLLDHQIAALDEQMNALLGIDTSVLSIGDAINNLASAVAAQASAQAALKAAQAVPVAKMPKSLEEIQQLAIEQIYKGELGRASDAAGMAFYLGHLVAGRTDIGTIASLVAGSEEAAEFDATGIPRVVPAYADGGTHAGGWRMVGERGPELEYTGPSKVVSNSSSKAMLDNRAVVAELQSIKPMLASIARSTGRTASDIDKWDNEGIPGTAFGEVLKTEAV